MLLGAEGAFASRAAARRDDGGAGGGAVAALSACGCSRASQGGGEAAPCLAWGSAAAGRGFLGRLASIGGETAPQCGLSLGVGHVGTWGDGGPDSPRTPCARAKARPPARCESLSGVRALVPRQDIEFRADDGGEELRVSLLPELEFAFDSRAETCCGGPVSDVAAMIVSVGAELTGRSGDLAVVGSGGRPLGTEM
jgi:hypothetical protein